MEYVTEDALDKWESGADFEIPDVTVRNEVSLFLFTPHTQAAWSWLNENVSEDSQWFASSLVVEPRYAPDLYHGLVEAGLVVR